MTDFISVPGDGGSTKERIMNEAAILFAYHGYTGVSVRDIASRVNIKAASIYNHFESKEALFNAILASIRRACLEYYDSLDARTSDATNFEQVLDCLFSDLHNIYDRFTFCGISLIATEQFRSQYAYEIFSGALISAGNAYAHKKLSDCIEKNWVKPFDTRGLSAIILNSITVSLQFRAHEQLDRRIPWDVGEMFASLRSFILASVELIP